MSYEEVCKMKAGGGYVKDYYYMFQRRPFLPASGYENAPKRNPSMAMAFLYRVYYNFSYVA